MFVFVLLILFSMLYYNGILLGVKWSILFNELNYNVSHTSKSDQSSIVNAHGSNIDHPSVSMNVTLESAQIIL